MGFAHEEIPDLGCNAVIVSRTMLISGLLAFVVGAGIVSARDHVILKWTPSVPVGHYVSSSPTAAKIVTFCLPSFAGVGPS